MGLFGKKKYDPEDYNLQEKLFPISKPWGYSPKHVSEAIMNYTKVIEEQKDIIVKLKEALARERNEKNLIDKELKNMQMQLNFVEIPGMSDIQEEYIQNKFNNHFNLEEAPEPTNFNIGGYEEPTSPSSGKSKLSILESGKKELENSENEPQNESNSDLNSIFSTEESPELKDLKESENIERENIFEDQKIEYNEPEPTEEVEQKKPPKRRLKFKQQKSNPFGGRDDSFEEDSLEDIKQNEVPSTNNSEQDFDFDYLIPSNRSDNNSGNKSGEEDVFDFMQDIDKVVSLDDVEDDSYIDLSEENNSEDNSKNEYEDYSEEDTKDTEEENYEEENDSIDNNINESSSAEDDFLKNFGF